MQRKKTSRLGELPRASHHLNQDLADYNYIQSYATNPQLTSPADSQPTSLPAVAAGRIEAGRRGNGGSVCIVQVVSKIYPGTQRGYVKELAAREGLKCDRI